MSRTHELIVASEQGKQIVASLFDGIPVSYEPRHKNDPKPWNDGFIRYSSRMCEARPTDDTAEEA